MSKRLIALFTLAALIGLAVIGLPSSQVTRAQDARPASEMVAQAQGGEDGPPVNIDERLGGKTGPVKVVVELVEDPAAEVYGNERQRGGSEAQATNAARARLAAIEQAQQQLVNQINALGGRVIYRTQRVYNGVATIVDAARLRDIARLPNVQAIHRLNTKFRDNSSSVPLIGAPAVWSGISGIDATGRGMKIAIIDSGIDYIHTDFGGDGTQASYTANNTTVVGDSPFFGGTNKVAGGYDFAGDDYNADPNSPAYQPIPRPDPDPSDCLSDPSTVGHGTHVAGTAAGFGVNADGTTYRGPYDTTTPFDSMRIGPGVAPEASLYALRVFGCEGSTDVTDQAIEYAVDPDRNGDFSDRMDVINMSLGSAYGSEYDTSAVASNNAVLAGVIVVASAGNSGDVYYINGSPGTAGRAISVAASQDKRDILDGFRVNSPPPVTVYPGSNSVAYSFPSGPVTGDLVYPTNPADRSGCGPITQSLAGKIVLLDWTKINGANECGSVARTTNAFNADAIGVVFVYSDPILDITITGSNRIPSIITTQEVGNTIKSLLATQAVNVTLTPEYNGAQVYDNDARTDTLASFSSRGPRRVDNGLKPDITAPGQTTFSALVQSGNKGQSLNGTSMAAPHVAGSMALLRQLHPTWTVEELKALAMNTATSEVRQGLEQTSTLYAPARTGAGRITLQQAAVDEVIAYNADGSGQVSVSFGAPEVVGVTTATRKLRVVNRSTDFATYDVTYLGRPATDVPGVTFSVSPSTVTLDANGGAAEVTVTMTANSAAMKHSRDTTVAATQGGLPRHWLSEESGFVVLTEDTGTGEPGRVLRTPVYAAPRPASVMRTSTSSLDFGTTPTATSSLPLAGREVNTGASFPTDERSIVTAFELQLASPNDPNSTGPADNADLKYVGVASDAPRASSFANTRIFFGIATYGNWSTPSSSAVEFDIYIDTNRDGVDDFALYNSNPSQTDVFRTTLLNLRTGSAVVGGYLNGIPASERNTVVYNTSVMAMPVSAGQLGLTAANSRFNYRIVSFSRDSDDPDGAGVDNTGVDDQDQALYLTYDAANPGVDMSSAAGVPAYDDLPGASIPVRFNRAAYDANRSQGILLFHHHNRTGEHDEVVRIITAALPQATATTAAATATTVPGQPTPTTAPPTPTTAPGQPTPVPFNNRIYMPLVFR